MLPADIAKGEADTVILYIAKTFGYDASKGSV
jgi:hypothetical protein